MLNICLDNVDGSPEEGTKLKSVDENGWGKLFLTCINYFLELFFTAFLTFNVYLKVARHSYTAVHNARVRTGFELNF